MPSLTQSQAAECIDLGVELHLLVQAEPGEHPETLADWRQRSHSLWLAVHTFGPEEWEA